MLSACLARRPLTSPAVPNGGYVASVVLRAASAHLAPRGQTDTVSAHWQFVNKTRVGPAVLVVEDTKLGRGLSVIHVTLYQGNLLSEHPWFSNDSRIAATAYITNGNMQAEAGVNLPTGWTIDNPPPPVDLVKLPRGTDGQWTILDHFLRDKVLSLQNVELYLPRSGHPLPATHDVWARLANGDRWLQDDMGYFIDIGPPLLVESYRPASPDAPIPEGGYPFTTLLWYPTIVASLEMKKRLPADGVEWLRYRTVCKAINNGRYDAEVMVFDVQGELVALSHHVAMAVGMDRNEKRGKSNQGGQNKL